MNALIVYESMFGNTRSIAEAIAEALESAGTSTTLAPAAAAPSDLSDFSLIVVGAPTHAHGLPRPESRVDAAEWAADPAADLVLEPTAGDSGVREWLDGIKLAGSPRFAVFSTRAAIPRIFAGDAGTAIAKRLRRHGAHVDAHEAFLVDLHNHLVDDEVARAREWAAGLVPVPTS
ncbi:flavodoxin family protein [Microbacterium pumilum]|uniref:Flavodoxin family protein n=1 Tax=Microbacterium pumilum TaxID=344165 RepID=A0ABN2RSA0_9MICO